MLAKVKSFLLAKYWEYRHLLYPGWADKYLENIGGPVNNYIADKVLALSPMTVFEFGSSSGPNLITLYNKRKNLHALGLDISATAVAAGRSYAVKHGIDVITFRTGDVRSLSELGTNSFDVAFSSAVLIYLDEASVKSAVEALLRIAKKGVIIVEQDSLAGESVFDGRKWLHDYKKIFSEAAGVFEVKSEKIPGSVWGGDWGKCGYVYTLIKPLPDIAAHNSAMDVSIPPSQG